MQDNFTKLDLSEYIVKFKKYLAREKPLYLEGDLKINYEKIQEISKFDVLISQNVKNLDASLMKLSKFGILHIDEIYEFVKIVKYFLYLKKIKFDAKFKAWLEKIEIPQSIVDITNYFNSSGELKEDIDERFLNLKNSLKLKNEQILVELKKIIYSKSLQNYMVDSSVHFIQDQECILLRGGFNHYLKGTIISRSANGFFYVVPNAVSKLKSEQSEIIDKYQELLYEYAKQISATFNKNLLFLKFINSAFDTADNLIARAAMAKENDLEFVLCDSSSDVVLKDFSHPALKNPKPVSISFTKKILLITGVNAGGKSMLLKSILSASLLAKYLLPMKINSTHSKIGSFKEFIAILEDPQNSKNDISTFAGRMISFSTLFHKKNALVGVDEIELGTDFEEAASLYSILLTSLIKNNIKLVVTTHHKRLALLLSKSDDVELVAALFDEEASRPKYEFLKGTIGKSYAFETALRYGIAKTFVTKAKELYGKDKQNLDQIIQKTLNLELELKEKLQSLDQKDKKIDALKIRLENDIKEFDEFKKELISKLELEFYNAINEARRGIKFENIKDKQRSINKANKLFKNIDLGQKDLAPDKFEVGNFAKFNNLKGEIVSINKNSATLLCDGIKLKAPLSSLKKISKNDMPKKNQVSISVTKPSSADIILDLHGLRVEEALERLDKFLNTSLIAGFDEVIIKHGIGTGKLARAVKEFLSDYKGVKEFYDAPPSEGGFGAKIVKF